MHINNNKHELRFYIFTVRNFMEHDLNILMIFGIKEKCIILTHTMYFLAIATNIAVLLMTVSVLQGHKLLDVSPSPLSLLALQKCLKLI